MPIACTIYLCRPLQANRQYGASSTKFFLNLYIDSILFQQRDKSSLVNFAQYDLMPYNIEIIS